MLRLQAQFPSTVSTVYRCVCPRVATQTWGGGLSRAEGSRRHPLIGPCISHPRTSEKLVKAPRDGRAAGPPGPRCLLCMCALDVDTAGPCHGPSGYTGVGLSSSRYPQLISACRQCHRFRGPDPESLPDTAPCPTG